MTREQFYINVNALKQAFSQAMANGQYYQELFDANSAIKFREQGFISAIQLADNNYAIGSDINVYQDTFKNLIRRINQLHVNVDFSQLGIDVNGLLGIKSEEKTK